MSQPHHQSKTEPWLRPVAFWDEEQHALYSEVVGGSKAPLSTDKTTWTTTGPNHGWPATIPGISALLKEGPRLGPNGERLAYQESYSVMYGWRGTDKGASDRRWMKTHVEMRGMAWTGELYQDFIVWMFVIRNIGTAPLCGLRAGVHSGFGYGLIHVNPNILNTDRQYYDPKLQLACGTGTMAPSIAIWDLKNCHDQLVAPGLYFFHLDSPIRTTTGRFIIIL